LGYDEAVRSLVVVVSLLSSVQLVMIGILGEYLGRIYEQVKGRPLYIVGETVNASPDSDEDERPRVKIVAAPGETERRAVTAPTSSEGA
jgi:dolichol-phosphate mannosyltransferase